MDANTSNEITSQLMEKSGHIEHFYQISLLEYNMGSLTYELA